MSMKHAFRCAFVLPLLVPCIASAQDVPSPTRSVQMNGLKLAIEEQGTSGPSVIFVSGVGEDHATWKAVQPGVASFARTLSYDRPGLGRSEPTDKPRGVDDLAAELHALLLASGLPPPYVLVGHSLGGAIVRVFAGRYPTQVGGLVLVDPEDGRLLDALRVRMDTELWKSREAAMEKALPNMPPPVREEMKGLNASSAIMNRGSAMPDVPVVLLTGTKKNAAFPGNPLEQDVKLEIHRQDLAAMPKAIHILVPTSRHYIQADEPQKVIDAIRTVVAAEPRRRGNFLPPSTQ